MQHHQLSGKCKSKPQWDITSHLSQWLLSKRQEITNVGEMWRKGTLIRYWWEYKLVKSLWKAVWRVFKKLRVELPYDPAVPLLGIYLTNTKTLIWEDTCTPIFITALFTIAKIWKQPKCPLIDEQIKKLWNIPHKMEYYRNTILMNIYNRILFSHKKEWKSFLCDNMNGP